MDKRSNLPSVSTPQLSMADVKARLNFSPSVQSPTPLPKRVPSSHLTLSHRSGDYHMTKQNPAILDHLHSPRQASVKDPMIYKSPTYVPPPPTLYTRSQLVHNTSLLQHTINSHRNSQPVGTSLVQLAVRGSQRSGENGLASPVIVRLSGTGSALRPRGGEEEEHPVANPCDKDVIMSALKQRRKRKAAASSSMPDVAAMDENSISIGPRAKKSKCNGLASEDLSNGSTSSPVVDVDGRKRPQDSFLAPLSKRNKGEGESRTSQHPSVSLRVPEVEFEMEAEGARGMEIPTIADRGKNKRPPSSRNASSTPPVVEEEERESPMLKKKREDSQQLHRTLTTIFPSGSQVSSGLRRKLPVFCATGSKPQLATQLTRTHWATDEDLRSDREALTEKVMQFLSEEPEDTKVTGPEVSDVTTSTSAAGALVPQKDSPLGLGFPPVAAGTGSDVGFSLSSAAPLQTSASTTGTSGIEGSVVPQLATTLPVGGTTGVSPRQPSQASTTALPLLGKITSAPFVAGMSAPSQPAADPIGGQTQSQPTMGAASNEASQMVSSTEAGKTRGGPLDIGTSSALPAGLQGMFSSSSLPVGSILSGGTQPVAIGLQFKSTASPQKTSTTSVTVTSSVVATQPSIPLASSLPGAAAGPSTLPMGAVGGFSSLAGLLQGSSQQLLPQLGSQQQQLPQLGSQQQLPQLGSQQQQLPQLGSQQQLPQLGSQQQLLPQLGSQQQLLPQLGSQQQLPQLGSQQQLPQLGSQQKQLPQLGSLQQLPQVGSQQQLPQPGSQQQQLPQLSSLISQGFGAKPQGNVQSVPTSTTQLLSSNAVTSTATNKVFSFTLAGNQSASTASLGSVPTVVGTSMAAGGQSTRMTFGQGGQSGAPSQQTALFGQSQGGGGQSLAANQAGVFGQSQGGGGQSLAANQAGVFGQSQGGQPAAASQFATLFGQPAQTPAGSQSTLFGKPAQAPAANQPALFSQPAQSPAANQPALFGQLAQASAANQSTMFGQPAQKPAATHSTLFGLSAQAPAANQSALFGNPGSVQLQTGPGNQSTLFGQPQGKPPQQTMFGQPQAPANANQPFAFGPSPAVAGQTAPSSGQPFVFGKPQVAVPPTQGQPGQVSLFGQAASSNQQQQQQLFMFGKPQSGQATTGQTGQTGSIFGPSQPAQPGQPGSLFAPSQPAQPGQPGSIFGPAQNALVTQPFGANGGNLQVGQPTAGQTIIFGQNGPKPAFQFGAPTANQTVSGPNSEGFKFGAPNQVGVNPSNQGSAGFHFGAAQTATPQSGFNFSQGVAPSLGGQQQSGMNFQVGGASGFNFGATQAPGNAISFAGTPASTTGNRTVAKPKRHNRGKK